MKLLSIILQTKKGENLIIVTSNDFRLAEAMKYSTVIYEFILETYKNGLKIQRSFYLENQLYCVANVTKEYILDIIVKKNDLLLAYDALRKLTDYFNRVFKVENISKKIVELFSIFEEFLFCRQLVQSQPILMAKATPSSKKKSSDYEVLNKFNYINSDIQKKLLAQNLTRLNKIKSQINLIKQNELKASRNFSIKKYDDLQIFEVNQKKELYMKNYKRFILKNTFLNKFQKILKNEEEEEEVIVVQEQNQSVIQSSATLKQQQNSSSFKSISQTISIQSPINKLKKVKSIQIQKNQMKLQPVPVPINKKIDPIPVLQPQIVKTPKQQPIPLQKEIKKSSLNQQSQKIIPKIKQGEISTKTMPVQVKTTPIQVHKSKQIQIKPTLNNQKNLEKTKPALNETKKRNIWNSIRINQKLQLQLHDGKVKNVHQYGQIAVQANMKERFNLILHSDIWYNKRVIMTRFTPNTYQLTPISQSKIQVDISEQCKSKGIIDYLLTKETFAQQKIPLMFIYTEQIKKNNKQEIIEFIFKYKVNEKWKGALYDIQIDILLDPNFIFSDCKTIPLANSLQGKKVNWKAKQLAENAKGKLALTFYDSNIAVKDIIKQIKLLMRSQKSLIKELDATYETADFKQKAKKNLIIQYKIQPN